MSDRLNKWNYWLHVFEPLMEREPEFYPLMLRMYAEISLIGCARYKSTETVTKPVQLQWAIPPANTHQDDTGIQVLFDPYCERSNYLGSCRKIANELSSAKHAFLQSSRHPIKYSDSDPQLHFDDALGFFNGFRTIKLWAILLRRSLLVDRHLFVSLLKHSFKILTYTGIIQSRLRKARVMLIENSVDWFVTPNEQSPLSSVFLVAAQLEGVRTGQFLHGMPTLLYMPFLSDEFWAWGSTSVKMLSCQNGWVSLKVKVMGALEFPRQSRLARQAESGGPNEKFRFLFLSQLVGDRVWETDAFSRAMRVIASSLADLEDWHVVVRLHPHADELIVESARSLFHEAGCDFIFSEEDSLEEDVALSDFVCTASSSAIVEALLQGKPCCLIWNDELSQIHGLPFLSEALVVRTKEALISRMLIKDEDLDVAYCESIENLAGFSDAAVQIARHLELSC